MKTKGEEVVRQRKAVKEKRVETTFKEGDANLICERQRRC